MGMARCRIFSLFGAGFRFGASCSLENLGMSRYFSKSVHNNSDWKDSVEKLLIPQRGAAIDGVVFTQQKHASVFCKAYRQTRSKDDRKNILAHLITHYGRSNLKEVSFESESDDKWLTEMTKLLKEGPPPYQQLFRAIGQLEDGIKFLVDLRADILAWLRESQGTAADPSRKDNVQHSPSLKLMDVILRDLLSIWFSIGLLEVERVTWKSSCDFLQRVAEYESVHPVRSWTDLKQRVGPYRRCFVFTHPSVPREPLVVLHVALMDRIPERIAEVIASRGDRASPDSEEDPNEVSAAIFYSINLTQAGLQGIDLGHFLIKRVVQQLSAELPSINAFSSLSPIPGFRKWLMEELRRRTRGYDSHLPLEPSEVSLVNDSLTEKNSWFMDETSREQLRPILLRTCAYYLLRLKHRGYAFDPVANFHLRNGAMLWRLNWAGDTTPKGLNQSCSIMVNNRYYLNRTDEYSRLYLDAKEVQAHDQVTDLLNVSQRSAL